MIIDPPEAEVGAIYPGKVVNITKFGAFVNILPGRDGLLHISKLGGGKRVDRVESVLTLGQEVEVKVDDIDPQGKVSLSLASVSFRRRSRRTSSMHPSRVQWTVSRSCRSRPSFEEELDPGPRRPRTRAVAGRDGGTDPTEAVRGGRLAARR